MQQVPMGTHCRDYRFPLSAPHHNGSQSLSLNENLMIVSDLEMPRIGIDLMNSLLSILTVLPSFQEECSLSELDDSVELVGCVELDDFVELDGSVELAGFEGPDDFAKVALAHH